jgi:glutathione-regulated potassium-efflux system ancillary protein KefC
LVGVVAYAMPVYTRKLPPRKSGRSFLFKEEGVSAMFGIWTILAFWIGLALLASAASSWLGATAALCEIVVGALARLLFGPALDHSFFDLNASWLSFLSGAGAMTLTFLAGSEIDPGVLKAQWKRALTIGLVGFFSPFLACATVAHFILGWSTQAAWLTGIALSTASVAVVYSVMIDSGLNGTDLGKTVLAACFVNGLGTIIGLGVLFSPFSLKSVAFLAASIAAVLVMPPLTTRLIERRNGLGDESEMKLLLLCLFGMGGLAVWAGSEAVLPSYIIGVALARVIARNRDLFLRVRSLAFGLLAPFYFIRAGSLVSLSDLGAAPYVLLLLLAAKMAAKFVGVYPTTQVFGIARKDGMYATLLMSTGLTFGSIAAVFGLSHGIIDAGQYSILLGTVTGSGIVSAFLANSFWMPRHLVPGAPKEEGNRLDCARPQRLRGAYERETACSRCG